MPDPEVRLLGFSKKFIATFIFTYGHIDRTRIHAVMHVQARDLNVIKKTQIPRRLGNKVLGYPFVGVAN